MAGMRSFEKGLYQQFEDLNKKLDKMIIENKNQSLTIYELNSTVKTLQQTIKKLEEQNKQLIEENEKFKNKNNKNSSNSSKPSSTNYTTPKRKQVPTIIIIELKVIKKLEDNLVTREAILVKKILKN